MHMPPSSFPSHFPYPTFHLSESFALPIEMVVHKKKKLMVDRRTETPLKVTIAKRKAHMWAVFFHTLETVDVIAVSVVL